MVGARDFSNSMLPRRAAMPHARGTQTLWSLWVWHVASPVVATRLVTATRTARAEKDENKPLPAYVLWHTS